MGVELDDAQTASANAALEDISAIARLYGLPSWGNPLPVPDAVKAVVLSATERRVRNPEGYVSEMAGEYNYRMAEGAATGMYFSATELDIIRTCAGRKGLASVPVQKPVVVAHNRYYPYWRNPDHGDI
ncbi:hypothetical protein [Kitasatospora griseola]|uniref:hypothetical protein n=1 Tax=Kitasatospora griseola TaxID=2064 RepID=UPI0007C82A2D|nr:hypothetical protein [Kitasatospora griseola]